MISLEDAYNDIIQKARIGHGLSLRTISDIIGVSPIELQAVEAGKKAPGEELANAIGLSYRKLQAIHDQTYMPPEILETIESGLVLKTFPVDVQGILSNAYILANDKRNALLFDAIGASEEGIAYIVSEQLIPTAILITHGHFDHTAGLEIIKEKFADIVIFEAGRDIKADGRVPLSSFAVTAFKTPGHTEDAVCFLVNDKIMFVGDTIFAGSIGRPNYSFKELIQNIKTKIFTLDSSIILATGHGPLTTIGHERVNNPFF